MKNCERNYECASPGIQLLTILPVTPGVKVILEHFTDSHAPCVAAFSEASVSAKIYVIFLAQ